MLAKTKKQPTEKEANPKTQPQVQRQSQSSKSSLAVTRRKVEMSNKQNLIQITEPLDSTGMLSQSKQFVLSRDSLSTNSRSKLKEMSNSSLSRLPHAPQVAALNQKERDQELFDRRLSLKCTANYSQQIDSQKSQRLSMAPLRRESFSTQLPPNFTAPNFNPPNFNPANFNPANLTPANLTPANLIEEKESTSSVYQNSLFSSHSKSRQNSKKQAIITNLMNKLDHEEDLRSIIELKLKSGSSSTQLHRQKRNQSYMTDFTEESSNHSMAAKLKQCQTQISYFKDIIKEMSEKIVELTDEKRFAKKAPHVAHSHLESNHQVYGFQKKMNDGCERCRNCECKGRLGQSSSKSVQTASVQAKLGQRRPNVNQSFDFLDNLERTLKVLERTNN